MTAYSPVLPDENTFRNNQHALLDEVLLDLACTPKRVSPIWFYDERGSELFEKICAQPEYYLARTELAIMHAHASDMAAELGHGATLIEFGSGMSVKTRLFLDRLREPAGYVPVDISSAPLLEAAGQIARDYPHLQIRPVCADFTQSLALPDAVQRATQKLVYFPGSTIGNFESDQAGALLRRMRRLAGRGGLIVIGVDLKKDVAMLERAYNDARGVTAAFNLNLLCHLNKRLQAHFNLSQFRHRAFWNEAQSRIEMHLISRCNQIVSIGDRVVRFDEGESLVTEYSHKYTLESFAQLAARGGLKVRKVWTDPDRLFSVQMLEAL